MNDGENVYFRGFGSFILKKRATKIARNISKNTHLTIPEHFIPKFKPAKIFVEKIKNLIFPILKLQTSLLTHYFP
jgi:DNA-binding protein HU-beta